MVCSNPHDALMEQVLTRTERKPTAIKEMIAAYEKRISETVGDPELLSDLRASLAAAKTALEIAEREGE